MAPSPLLNLYQENALFKLLMDTKKALVNTKPLVLNLTNMVSASFVANVLLAAGASPLMSQDAREIQELSTIANVVVVNPGTLDLVFEATTNTLLKTLPKTKPLVLDPVGAGASNIRTALARNILPHAHVIRGNHSEIAALGGDHHEKTHGVDSSLSQPKLSIFPLLLSQIVPGGCLATTGARDTIFCKEKTMNIDAGSPLLTRITGTGCALSALIGAFVSISPSPYTGSALAILFYNLCAEQAAQKTENIGSFSAAFLDALFSPNDVFFKKRIQDLISTQALEEDSLC